MFEHIFRRKEKGRYTFLERGEMPRAKASLLFSAASLGILLVMMLLAYLLQGKAPLAIGAAGLVGLLMAGYAFAIGIKALSRHESKHRVCVAAATFSGLMSIIWLTVFLNGLG